MRGKTAVVTGGTRGVGLETARALAGRGARVFVTGRDVARGEAAVRSLRLTSGNREVHFVRADFGSLAGVRTAAEVLGALAPELHVLVNNAAEVPAQREETPDGFERTWAVTALAPLLLTELLFDRLRAGAGRVVSVSSGAHRCAVADFGDVAAQREAYVPLRVHGRAKLAGVLTAYAQARRWEGTGVTVALAEPRLAATGTAGGPGMPAACRAVLSAFGRWLTPGRAAASSIAAATDPALSGRTALYVGPRAGVGVSAPETYDVGLQEHTYAMCLQMVLGAGWAPAERTAPAPALRLVPTGAAA